MIFLRSPLLPGVNFLTIILFYNLIIEFGISLNFHVDFYETLNYQPISNRRKRSLGDDGSVDLIFHSHNRTFDVKLLPIDKQSDIFDKNFFMDVDSKFQEVRPHEFLYEGYLKNNKNSLVYGSIIGKIFEGHIILSNGESFTVEKAARYFDIDKRPKDFHSFIYHDNQINHKKYFVPKRKKRDAKNEQNDSRTGCGMTEEIHKQMKRFQESVSFSENEDISLKSHSKSQSDFLDQHSYIEPEFVSFPFRYTNHGQRIRRNVSFKNDVQEIAGKRLYTVRTCTMYLQADQKLYKSIYDKEGSKDHIRTREEIVGLFYNHIKAVNQIYESTDFGGVRGLNFVIRRTSIYTPDTCDNGRPVPDSDNPFCEDNVDVSNYLNLNSHRNHSAFCLAYALTFRDFAAGTLGLAWVANPTFSTGGGICQIYQKYNEAQHGSSYRSLNTGIVTLVNYGNRVPLRVSQLTMAHEIGHNFGSPHDPSLKCQPGLPDGNYIMFASATSGDKINNAKFSKCSIESISQVLYKVLMQPPVDSQVYISMYGKQRNCFQERTTAFCGNQIPEPGEQCDCGFAQRDCDEMGDRCCYPREHHQNSCRRKFNSLCSPSEGSCCNSSTCNFYLASENRLCRSESECLLKQYCDGRAAACPESQAKPDGSACQDVTKVCQSGSCNGSICATVGLKDCFLTEGKPEKLCHLACEKNGTCYSSFDLAEFAPGKFFQKNRKNMPGLLLHPGSPCNNYKGYCDILRKCRSVDSNGPLARLKNLLFNKYTINTVSQWVQEHWWICVLIGIGVLLFMALFVKCCAVHTPSTNPNKIPAQHFSDTLRHPGTLLRRTRQNPQHPNASFNNPPSSGTQLNSVISNGNVHRNGRSGGGHHRVHNQRQQNYKSRHKNGTAQTERRSQHRAHSSNTSTSNHRNHSSSNRTPTNHSTPPLIPNQAALLISSPQILSSIHDPPPPYTPTDPAASILSSGNASNFTVAQDAQNRASLIIGLTTQPSVPAAISLPGAPLPPSLATVPLVPGPPLPGQGPKPGRRRPKQLENVQKKSKTQSLNNSSVTSNALKSNKRPVK